MKALRVIVVLFAVTTFLGCPPVIPPQTIQMCAKTTDCNNPPAPPTEWLCDEGPLGAIVSYTPAGPTLDIDLQGAVGVPDQDYTLIYYPDPYPASGLVCLGSGHSDATTGVILISSSNSIGYDLPIEGDPLSPGAKLMLVDSANVDCTGQTMTGWGCNGLFEVALATDLISYTYIP